MILTHWDAPLICGHCFAPMEAPPVEKIHRSPKLVCSARCAKSAKTNKGRLWRTREGRVLNMRWMEDSHLQAAIRYLEQHGRAGTQGYQWLCEERTRRGLPAVEVYKPPPTLAYDVQCGACGAVAHHPPAALDFDCVCGQRIWNKREPLRIDDPPPVEIEDESELDPPQKRGVNLKGVPKVRS